MNKVLYIMHEAFDFGTMFSDLWEWNCKTFGPLQLCETLKAAILKDRAQRK